MRAYGEGIACPACLSTRSCVTDSRPQADGAGVRRRRECDAGHRFTTYEVACAEPMVLRPGSSTRPFEVVPLSDWTARIGAALSSGVPELVRRVMR